MTGGKISLKERIDVCPICDWDSRGSCAFLDYNHDICPRCMYHFGYDAMPESVPALRRRWNEQGKGGIHGCLENWIESNRKNAEGKDVLQKRVLELEAERDRLRALCSHSLEAVRAWQRDQQEYHPWSVDGWKLEADLKAALLDIPSP